MDYHTGGVCLSCSGPWIMGELVVSLTSTLKASIQMPHISSTVLSAVANRPGCPCVWAGQGDPAEDRPSHYSTHQSVCMFHRGRGGGGASRRNDANSPSFGAGGDCWFFVVRSVRCNLKQYPATHTHARFLARANFSKTAETLCRGDGTRACLRATHTTEPLEL